jgi:Bifunctional DNA primase/polymerase, N-terminal
MDNASDVFPANSFIEELRSALDVPFAEGEEITDRYLNRAIGFCCTEVYGRLRLSKNVRNLIASNAPANKPRMNQIPQERRRQFLTELASITGRALPPREPISAEPRPLPQEPTQAEAELQAKAPMDGQSPRPPELPNWDGPVQPGDAPMSADPSFAGQDAKLISNGYEPIAVNGKAPVAKGWNERPNTIEAVAAERAHHPGATSTGLRTGRLVGVDIDIIPAEHVQAVKRLVFEVLGLAMLERVGAKGAMLCYRNEAAVGKITVSGKHPTLPGKIEILGAGQQFVSYGIHPDTGRRTRGRTPQSVGNPCEPHSIHSLK